MLFSALSVLAPSAVSFASPAARASLDFAPTSGVRRSAAGGDRDYKGKEDHWAEKDWVPQTDHVRQQGLRVRRKADYRGAYDKALCDEDKVLVEISKSLDTWGSFDIKTLNGPDTLTGLGKFL
ncbi:hypothetical protein BDZ89DRAFT_1135615 [Hymenopellis radicata]|nr:hypothetical protein BDZ89DRAFT_1135615 [Hymenopellis radicata]